MLDSAVGSIGRRRLCSYRPPSSVFSMDSGPDNDASGNGRQPEPRPQGESRSPRRGLRRLGMLPQPPGPTDSDTRTKPRMRKLRFAVVILGLSVRAFVSWTSG